MTEYQTILSQYIHRQKEGSQTMWIYTDITSETINQLKESGYKIEVSPVVGSHPIYKISER